jgi:hypothetical protein
LEEYYELVGRLTRVFDERGLIYGFTGALAASFYGVPRTSVDVDVLVAVVDAGGISDLVVALRKARLVVDEGAVEKALRSDYRIATFKDTETAYTVDVILSSETVDRRKGRVGGVETFFQSPESLVSAKLRMIKATVPKARAQKDVADVKAILKFTKVDLKTIEEKAKREGTFSLFKGIQKEE